MTRRMRFAPCPHPGCPALADECARHRRKPWAGRNGTTRTAALGVNDTTWRKLRTAAIRRDASRCRRCGEPAIEVDHLIPLAWRRPPAGFSAHLAMLLCLCRACHRAKTNEEASIGRSWGSPPPLRHLEAHAQRWRSTHAAL